MKRFGLIGYPLGHSFSGTYFNNMFIKAGIDAEYNNYPLKSINELKSLILEDKLLEGLNVTRPFKEEILPFLDYIDPPVKNIGAVNVVRIIREEIGTILLAGYNTDIIGFRESLTRNIDKKIEYALILGTGGASKAVAAALKDLSIEYIKVSRDPERGGMIYDDLDEEVISKNQLIINTSPVGTYPELDNAPDIPYNFINKNHTLYDLVYNPPLTRFLRLGKEMGAKVIGGLEMLHIQAEEAWKIWNSQSLR